MPDIGIFELIVVGLAMFVILGPERVPEFFTQIARVIRKARAWMNATKAQINEEAQRVRDPIVQAKETVRGELEKAADEVVEASGMDARENRARGGLSRPRPLSEVYAEMRRPADDDASQGFMQGHGTAKTDAPEEKKPHGG